MPNYPQNALQQARSVLTAWPQINDGLTFGDLNLEALTMDVESVGSTHAQINNLETQLTHLRNQRDAQMLAVWDKVKRVRAGIKSIYGDDFSEWEMIGGNAWE